jgi:hypothetical protein
MNKALHLSLLGLIVLYCECGQLSLAGGSSQQGNGMIVGYVVLANGSHAKATQIRVRLTNYVQIPGAATNGSGTFNAVTDSTGHFSIPGIYPGSYTIEANDRASFAALIKTTVEEQNGIADVGTVSLKPYARIFGVVDAAATAPYPQRYIQVQGLERLARVGLDGTFAIVDLPEGSFDLRLVTTDTTTAPVEMFGINALSDVTETVVIPAGWRYARRLYLNTTAYGADVAGNVTDVPVLVRLITGNFDFSQAKNDGADLRFAKSDGSRVAFEIERWDPVAGLAEVWVKADTVYGNGSTQSLTMYWGNVDAARQPNSEAVFDTASGFVGVWHLSETTGASAGEATYNGFSGIYNGWLPNIQKGPLGNCQNIIRPDKDYIDMGNVLNPGLKNISIGFWIKRAAFGTQQAVIAKTNGDAPSAAYGYLFSIDLFNYPHFYMASGGAQFGDDGVFDITSNLTLTDSTTWHHVFVSIDRSDKNRCRMFVDGIDRTGTLRGNVSRVADVANSLHLRIGTENDNNYSYKGSIAEATVAFTARSADWIKLCYENQKAQDALVRW